MPSENLRWETLEALKNSPKGQLKYNPCWAQNGEDILAGWNDAISLSPFAGHVVKRLSTQKNSPRASALPESSPGLCDEIPLSLSSATSFPSINNQHTALSSPPPAPSSKSDNEQQVVGDEDTEDLDQELSPVSSPTSPPAISLFSPRATTIAGCILLYEKNHHAKAKMALSQRQEKYNQLVTSVASRESEQLKRFEELMALKQRQEYQTMRDMVDRETKESIGRQEKLKEEHRNRMKILNLRLREAEQQRQRESELERQRLVEGRERLRQLNTIQEEILQLNQLLEPATQSNADLTSYVTRGNQLCSQVSEVVRTTAEGAFPTVEDMAVAERALHEMNSLRQEVTAKALEWRKKEAAAVEEARKLAELKAQQEEQKKAALLAKEKAQKKGLQTTAESSTLNWYKELQDSSAQCLQSFESLSTSKDPQIKKIKTQLQKSATIPVSQISVYSSSTLREIFDKLDKLLSGRQVVSGGMSVSTSQHPKAQDFVCYKLAEKFVKQGDEEVASHHEAAFPIAAVAIGIWEQYPKVGEIILAHLHKMCPYSLPHYPPMKDGTSVEDYQRLLGYRVNEDGVEGQDSFLKRMSGMIRLYAAIIQQKWPYSTKQGPSPHGLNHGWRWLAQMLNMEPLADITATLLFDFLEVCGNALMMEYRGQFWKLLQLIKEEYLPRIEAVTSTGEMGSVARLRAFLEKSIRSRQISPPKGQLTASFWRT